MRSFSLLLARRYLNPRRTVLSSFSLVSLLGVMFGVMVLIVVMAVYAGMEREIKNRILGFSPHVLVRTEGGGVEDWQEEAKKLRQVPGVETATAFIDNNVVIDVDGMQLPVAFRGVDAGDIRQVEGIRAMLDVKQHPESTADLGLDDRVVVSSHIAEQFKLQVGDPIRLYSTRNFDQVLAVYKTTEKPPLRVQFKERWDKIKAIIGEGWDSKDAKGYTLSEAKTEEAYNLVVGLTEEKLRGPELERLQGIYTAMENSEPDENGGVRHFTTEDRQKIRELVAETDVADADKMDGDALKALKQIVLPKEAKVVGVYQSSQMAITPDIFVPLPLAQDLAGLDDKVMGISLRLHDPYLAGEVAQAVAGQLDPTWSVMPWMKQPSYERFFSLISQQRVMMYFALSFIVLVAAFSMMAVMFTVTLLKRREIGVMKALGASSGQIVCVFLYQGMLLGALGAALGFGLGRLVILYRGVFQEALRGMGFDPFAASFTGFSVLPAYNNPAEQLAIAVAAFVLCALAAALPAFFAARSDAAKSLRNL